MLPYRVLFYFIGLFYCKALTVKVDKNVQNTLLKGSSYKLPKVKKYFIVNIDVFPMSS